MKDPSATTRSDRRRGKRLLPAAAAALAAAAVGLAIVRVVQSFYRPRREEQAGFRCTQCAKEWRIRADDPQGWRPFAGRSPALMTAMDCPECGSKKSVIPLVRCPGCGRWYPSAFARTRPSAGRRSRDVCPDCGIDRAEWLRGRHGGQ